MTPERIITAMDTLRRLVLASLLVSAVVAAPARAVEYRLDVANLRESALYP